MPKDGVVEDTEAIGPPVEMAVPGRITVHKRRKVASINTDDSMSEKDDSVSFIGINKKVTLSGWENKTDKALNSVPSSPADPAKFNSKGSSFGRKSTVAPNKLTPRRLKEQERRRFLNINVPVRGAVIKTEQDDEKLNEVKGSLKKAVKQNIDVLNRFQAEPITDPSYVNRHKIEGPIGQKVNMLREQKTHESKT